MTFSAKNWTDFAREVARSRTVWTIRDASGFPAPMDSEGKRAQPFWSSKRRAERVIEISIAYSSFSPYEISWEEFRDKWLPGLDRDGILVGVNWSGARAVGYDVTPKDVRERIDLEIQAEEFRR